MPYICEDKNGKYLGSTYSKTEAQNRVLRANVDAMRKEGVDPYLLARYEVEQRRQLQKEREKDYKRTRTAFYIFLGVIIFIILTNLLL